MESEPTAGETGSVATEKGPLELVPHLTSWLPVRADLLVLLGSAVQSTHGVLCHHWHLCCHRHYRFESQALLHQRILAFAAAVAATVAVAAETAAGTAFAATRYPNSAPFCVQWAAHPSI